MLLVDSDEIWTKEQLDKLFESTYKWPRSAALPLIVYTVTSLIFINDFKNVSTVIYPRMWEIEYGSQYEFVEPNRILVNGYDFDRWETDAYYFHPSYCHSSKRFMAKKRERTLLHGFFPWRLEGGKVVRKDAKIEEFRGQLPECLENHPINRNKS